MPSLLTPRAVMHTIQHQELHELIIPVLACLPTAFFSPSPPPALLPLLSPILRQRVHLLSHNASEALSQGSWLKLLTWSSERAERLTDVVSRLQLEPHPVSGELELFGDINDPDAGKVWYRRLDEETVQARCDVKQYNLGFIFVWAVNDTGSVSLEHAANGSAQDAWKTAEVIPLEGDENLELEGWQDDLTKAEHNESRSMQAVANGRLAARWHGERLTPKPAITADDDDDYWASYDRTPGKATPVQPRAPSLADIFGGVPSEQEYFARYSEVQPAMDPHDPDEDAGTGEWDTVPGATPGQAHDRTATDFSTFMNLNDAIEKSPTSDIAMPTGQRMPAPETSSLLNGRQSPPSPTVASLERSVSEASTAAETTVKHHISHELKSLFRLAQGVGMERDEFAELVQRELEVLGQIDL